MWISFICGFPCNNFKHIQKFVFFSHEKYLYINKLTTCKLHLQPLQNTQIYLQSLQIYDLYMCKMAKNIHNFLILIFQ